MVKQGQNAVAKRKKKGIAWKFGVFNGLLWVEKDQSGPTL
jgi:hypothetical protein